MSGKTHMLVSISAGMALMIPTNSLPMIVLGGLFVDNDSEESILGRIIPLWKIFKHRHFLHSVFIVIITFCCDKWIGIGCLLHIICDLPNYRKVHLFSPFKFGSVCLNWFKVNGWQEWLIDALLICYIFYFHGLVYTLIPEYFKVGLSFIIQQFPLIRDFIIAHFLSI